MTAYRLNQAARQQIFTRVTGSDLPLAPGDREMTLAELGRGIQVADNRPDRAQPAALETEWHKRLALPAACVVLTLLGLAFADVQRLRALPWLGVLYPAVLLGYYALLRAGEQAADDGHVSPFLAIWTPNLLALLTARLLSSRAKADWPEQRSGFPS